MTTDDYESWRVALARVEGKIDTMVELATHMQVAVTDLDRRVRDVETSMARVKQQLSAGTVHNTLAYRYYPLLLPGGVMPT